MLSSLGSSDRVDAVEYGASVFISSAEVVEDSESSVVSASSGTLLERGLSGEIVVAAFRSSVSVTRGCGSSGAAKSSASSPMSGRLLLPVASAAVPAFSTREHVGPGNRALSWRGRT